MNNRNQRERGREQEAFKVRRLLWGVPAAPSGEGKPYPGVGIPGGGPYPEELPFPRQLPSGKEEVPRQCPPGDTAPRPFFLLLPPDNQP